jgi:uncharacterized protein (TIGR02145 family)
MLFTAFFVLLVFVTCSKDKSTKPSELPTVTDIDGNVYHTVAIGTQIWMAENLRVTHYRNGQPIPNVTDGARWDSLITGAYCNYNNTPFNDEKYGKLYNWFVIADTNGIAPAGWHVPSAEEWQILIDYLGGNSIAGGKLKERGTHHWNAPNVGASNKSGFSAVPNGYRHSQGDYWHQGYYGFYWTATWWVDPGPYAYFIQLTNDIPEVFTTVFNEKKFGHSIRCIKD